MLTTEEIVNCILERAKKVFDHGTVLLSEHRVVLTVALGDQYAKVIYVLNHSPLEQHTLSDGFKSYIDATLKTAKVNLQAHGINTLGPNEITDEAFKPLDPPS